MLITAARLFDGRGDSIVDDPLIAVEDGRIAAVTGRSASPVDSPDLLDLGDVTVLPGLIDIHQHLAFDASAGGPDNPRGRASAHHHQWALLVPRRRSRRRGRYPEGGA